ncbi:MAG TPA: saccharopine dehydrogenase NADP-binding domain-containing protein [Candidatus Eisenbacteria bacterium]|nr:saccharopine dehydrogenase NADP-binding domain-containing protein [Candidatus Eisenbacteria bacterium]
MRVFIVGAGAVGSIMAEMLGREFGKKNVRCGDRDPARARRFMSGEIVRVDASRTKDVARAAKGADLVINAGLPDFNLNVMAAALAAGAHYQDLCSRLEDLRHAEQLRLHGQFRKAGRVALFNTGVAPGLTNLLAAELAAGLDRTRAIRIRLLEEQDADEPVMSWSPRVIVDEMASPPLVYEKGRFGNVKPFSGAETFVFPRPFGPRRVVAVYGDEVATIPLYLKVGDVDMKCGGTDITFGESLFAAGLLGSTPVKIGGQSIRPRDLLEAVAPKVPTPAEMRRLIRQGKVRNSWLVAAVEAEGTLGGRRATRTVTAVFPDLRQVMRLHAGATYVSYPTALCAAAFSKTIPGLRTPGAIPPEALEGAVRKTVLRELKGAGVRFVRRESKRGKE